MTVKTTKTAPFPLIAVRDIENYDGETILDAGEYTIGTEEDEQGTLALIDADGHEWELNAGDVEIDGWGFIRAPRPQPWTAAG